jgi:hypothetical protein
MTVIEAVQALLHDATASTRVGGQQQEVAEIVMPGAITDCVP